MIPAATSLLSARSPGRCPARTRTDQLISVDDRFARIRGDVESIKAKIVEVEKHLGAERAGEACVDSNPMLSRLDYSGVQVRDRP